MTSTKEDTSTKEIKLAIELTASLWRKLFLSLKEEGFTEDQAFHLLEVYIRVSYS